MLRPLNNAEAVTIQAMVSTAMHNIVRTCLACKNKQGGCANHKSELDKLRRLHAMFHEGRVMVHEQ